MNGVPLLLGVVGGLALAGAVRSGGRNLPSLKSSSPSFRRLRPLPTGFTLSPLPFVRGFVLQDTLDPDQTGRPGPGVGLYHVTTNLPAVLAEGRLRSRRELRLANRQGAGLGGGVMDEAPDRVSVGVMRDGALRVLRGTRMMARAVHGEIGAAEALEIMKDISGDAVDALDKAAEWMTEGDDDPENQTPEAADAQALEDDLLYSAKRVLAATPGPALYTSLSHWEHAVAEATADWIRKGHLSADEFICSTTVGFTEPAHRFERVHAKNVGLLQLAARKGAGVDFVNEECELRFRPEDLVIVGVWTP